MTPYHLSKSRKAKCAFCYLVSSLILSCVFLSVSTLASAGQTYIFGDISIGSVVSRKLDIDGDIPAWIAVGVEYETSDRLFLVQSGVKHRSNMDRSGEDVEYSLDSIFIGAKFRFKVSK